MRQRMQVMLLSAATLALTEVGQAQGVIVYPAKGQSAEQQNRDRYECHAWAVGQSGFDPSQSPYAAQPLYGPGPMRGAMRGAAVGAVGGAIGGDAGRGAAIGAATGGLIGGFRRRDMINQQYSQYQQQQTYYNRALGACMQARGYMPG